LHAVIASPLQSEEVIAISSSLQTSDGQPDDTHCWIAACTIAAGQLFSFKHASNSPRQSQMAIAEPPEYWMQ
jgi:hypothetical protein